MIARHPCDTQRALLPLLPSGPGGVRRVSLRRTRLSTRCFLKIFGGEGGIRTHGTPFGRTHDFQSGPFGLSGTSPQQFPTVFLIAETDIPILL
jgi:hypothetical protein